MVSNKIVGLATPIAGTDGANKSYVDSVAAAGSSGGVPVDFQTFLTAGSFSWTKPSTGTMVFVECWG